MQTFEYLAKNKEGEVQKGEVEAENVNAAAKVLMSRDLIPVDVYSQTQKGLSFFNKVSLKEKTIIARQLATMINAGLPISQSLRTIQGQVSNPTVKKMLEQITTDVEGGSTVSNAFAKFPETFTPLDITLISSGETSGSLDKALLRLADTLEKEQSLVRKVRGALVYPAFLILAVIALVTVMVIYVMPQMASLYKSFNASLPLLTRMMISMSNFLGHYGFIFFAFLIGVGIYIRVAIQKPWGRRIWDKFKINTWGIGALLRKLYMARFAQTLSGLVGAGVPLLDGLKIVSKSIGNVVYEEEIMAAAEKVKAGIALSEPLKNNPLFPTVVPEMIAVGEKTGELDAMLANLAAYFEEEVAEIVKNMSNLIEPIMIVVLGGIIGIILVAILLPIYSLGGVILGT